MILFYLFLHTSLMTWQLRNNLVLDVPWFDFSPRIVDWDYWLLNSGHTCHSAAWHSPVGYRFPSSGSDGEKFPTCPSYCPGTFLPIAWQWRSHWTFPFEGERSVFWRTFLRSIVREPGSWEDLHLWEKVPFPIFFAGKDCYSVATMRQYIYT